MFRRIFVAMTSLLRAQWKQKFLRTKEVCNLRTIKHSINWSSVNLGLFLAFLGHFILENCGFPKKWDSVSFRIYDLHSSYKPSPPPSPYPTKKILEKLWTHRPTTIFGSFSHIFWKKRILSEKLGSMAF